MANPILPGGARVRTLVVIQVVKASQKSFLALIRLLAMINISGFGDSNNCTCGNKLRALDRIEFRWSQAVTHTKPFCSLFSTMSKAALTFAKEVSDAL